MAGRREAVERHPPGQSSSRVQGRDHSPRGHDPRASVAFSSSDEEVRARGGSVSQDSAAPQFAELALRPRTERGQPSAQTGGGAYVGTHAGVTTRAMASRAQLAAQAESGGRARADHKRKLSASAAPSTRGSFPRIEVSTESLPGRAPRFRGVTASPIASPESTAMLPSIELPDESIQPVRSPTPMVVRSPTPASHRSSSAEAFTGFSPLRSATPTLAIVREEVAREEEEEDSESDASDVRAKREWERRGAY